MPPAQVVQAAQVASGSTMKKVKRPQNTPQATDHADFSLATSNLPSPERDADPLPDQSWSAVHVVTSERPE